MIEQDRRIRIITGNYGSGKTEFAVNYTMKLKEKADKVALADLDIVNVYFRSRQRQKELTDRGVWVISSSLAGNAVDIPAVPAEIVSPLRNKEYQYIIDLGGNDVGTKVLAQLKKDLNKNEVDFFMVVNVFRPETSTVDLIIKMKKNLEDATGLFVTGFIHNSNLIRQTSGESLLFGNEILLEVSKITGVSIRYCAYAEEIIKNPPLGLEGELFPLELTMRETWM